MGRAVDNLSTKLANAEVIRLSADDRALIREIVALSQVAGEPGARTTPPKKRVLPGDVRAHDTRMAAKRAAAAKKPAPKKATKGGSRSSTGSDFESKHPRNVDGTFAYKEDSGGSAGIGTKDAGLPKGKPDGKVHGRISEAQAALVKLGDLKSTDGRMSVAVDGLLGRHTQAALKKFQQRNKLKVTGQIDPATTKALGLKETVELSAPVVELAKKGTLDWSPTENWVDKSGGLPKFIEEIALALIRDHGMDRSRAIATAISRVKRWAAGGDGVKPDTVAKAQKAVSEWTKLKARNAARKKD